MHHRNESGTEMQPNPQATQPEILVSAVLHLMSHYSMHARQPDRQQACQNLAPVIELHLNVLSGLPELTPVLRATCQQLAEQWSAVVQRPQPAARTKRFSWLMPEKLI